MNLKIFYLVFILSGLSFGQNQLMIPYVKNSKWGFSDVNKKILITPQYDSVSFFENRIINQKKIAIAPVYLNNRVGIIDSQNKSIIPIKYLHIEKIDNSDLFIALNEQNKYGIINFTTAVLPFEYDEIRSIMHNSYLVKKNNKLGIADKYAKIVVPVIYDQINFMEVDKEKKTCRWRVANEKITQYVFTPYQPNDEYSFSGGIEELTDYAISTTKPTEFSIDYDYKIPLRNVSNVFITQKNNLFGFINENTNIGFLPKYEKLDFLNLYFDRNNNSNYFLIFNENDKKGLTNQSGAILLPALYDKIDNTFLYIETYLDDKKGVFFKSTHHYIEPKFKTIKNDIELNESFIVILVSEDNNNFYYIGENGNSFKE